LKVDDVSADSPEVDYDSAEIARFERLLHEQEAGWRQFFNQLGSEPFVIYYEDFVRTYRDTILSVLAFLGVQSPSGLKIQAPRLKKQADETVEDWVRRYREEKRVHNAVAHRDAVADIGGGAAPDSAKALTHDW